MAARRYRSTHGWWSIPYVDDTRLVFVPPRDAGNRALVAAMILAQIAGCCATALGNSGTPLPAWVQHVSGVGFACALFPLCGCLQTVPLAASLSRMHPVVRRLVVERVVDPSGRVAIEGVVDGHPIAPTRQRMLVRASLLGQRRLLLVLGDSVLELSRSTWYSGGRGLPPPFDWVSERLVGGEGSARAGEPESGHGVLLPVVENLRSVLSLEGENEARIQGPGVPASAWATLLLLGAAASAATFGVDVALGHLSVFASSPPLLAAIGLAAGALLVASEWMILRTWHRLRLVPIIDTFVAAILAIANAKQGYQSDLPFR